MARTIAEFSLSAKLQTLAVGDHLYLPDRPNKGRPSDMQSAVTTAQTRAKGLAGRKFTTTRGCAVNGVDAENVETVLRVERIK